MSPAAGARRLERDYFEGLYEASADPWDFATSAYEREKYDRSLDALGERHFERALEVGCSIGVFTERLAARCDELLAVDISDRAVAAAAERTAPLAHVTVERRSLPEDTPAGPFDLVVCSEVLYYWTEAVLGDGLDALAGELRPGGLMLAVHWTEPTDTYPLQGAEAHRLLAAHPAFRALLGRDHPSYRLDLLERA